MIGGGSMNQDWLNMTLRVFLILSLKSFVGYWKSNAYHGSHNNWVLPRPYLRKELINNGSLCAECSLSKQAHKFHEATRLRVLTLLVIIIIGNDGLARYRGI
jgi:hypothetical protein